jgi:hypothetical protein
MEENKASKLDILYPELERVKLGGISCFIERLKFKHTIIVARMLTKTIGFIDWENLLNSDQKQMTTYLLMAMVYSPDDFYTFLESLLLCNKDEREKLVVYLKEGMTNDEALEVAEKSLKQDFEEIRGWLKKVMTLSQPMEKMEIPQKKRKS